MSKFEGNHAQLVRRSQRRLSSHFRTSKGFNGTLEEGGAAKKRRRSSVVSAGEGRTSVGKAARLETIPEEEDAALLEPLLEHTESREPVVLEGKLKSRRTRPSECCTPAVVPHPEGSSVVVPELTKKGKSPGYEGKHSDGAKNIKKKERKRKTIEKELETAQEKACVSVEKSTRKSSGKAKADAAKKVSRKKYLTQVEYDGEVFRVGDSAYVVLNPDEFDWGADEREVCVVCGCDDDETVIECDRCLLGFHLKCLAPPLKAVPMGSWMCQACRAGQPIEKRDAVTAREKFLSGGGILELARVEAIWKDEEGVVKAVLRWYYRPEDTCTGRQAHHGAREVFLSNQTDVNEVAFLLRPAVVVSPRDFSAQDTAGDDVFLCEYEYDCKFRLFRRCSERDVNEQDVDWDWDVDQEDSDADDSADEDFDVKAQWKRERTGDGHGRQKKLSPGKRAEKRRRKQGGGLDRPGGNDLFGAGSNWADDVDDQDEEDAPAGESDSMTVPLALARAALTLSARPRSLPCRGKEKEQIQRFLQTAISSGTSTGNCLYISGVPGTGKTATCLEVVRRLQRSVHKGQLPAFRFVEINGLRLATPYHAYTALYEALTGCHAPPTRAVEELEALFSKPSARKGKRMMTVVMLDEMDLMVTRKQTVLYNLFDWPTRAGADLAVIGIANTMDLPERLLPRIASRLGKQRAPFLPYSQEQVKEIIATRLKGIPAYRDPKHGLIAPFQGQAMVYVSRKVASVSGDCRRALELCRRAAEIADAERRRNDGQSPKSSPTGPLGASTGLVRMQHVDQAVREMFNSTHVQIMHGLPRAEKLLLGSVLLEIKATGRADTSLQAVAERYRSMTATAPGEPTPQMGRLIGMAAHLGALRICLCDGGAVRWRMRLALNIPAEDAIYVLKCDTSFKWLHGLL